MNIIEQFVALLEETERHYWFQPDNVRPQVARNTMAVLKSFFDDCLISSGLWPPRSPDLSPLDYFLWGYLKDRVYSPAPVTFEDLKADIVRKITLFSMLQNVINNAIKCAQACIQGAGDQLEHSLKYFLQYIFTIVLLFFPLNF